MREVLARAAAGDQRAELAREVYLHRLRGCVAGMAAAMDGLDVLVFTGGVGENSAEIRSRAMRGLGFLGIREDAGPNTAGNGDREIGLPEPRSAAWSSAHARTSRSPARYGQHCNSRTPAADLCQHHEIRPDGHVLQFRQHVQRRRRLEEEAARQLDSLLS